MQTLLLLGFVPVLLSPALAQQTSSTALPSVPNFDPPRAVPLDATPDLAFSEVDWVVYASDLEGDRLFLGGNFQRVGPKVGSFIRADPELTEIHKDGPRIEGGVRAAAATSRTWAVSVALASRSSMPRHSRSWHSRFPATKASRPCTSTATSSFSADASA